VPGPDQAADHVAQLLGGHRGGVFGRIEADRVE